MCVCIHHTFTHYKYVSSLLTITYVNKEMLILDLVGRWKIQRSMKETGWEGVSMGYLVNAVGKGCWSFHCDIATQFLSIAMEVDVPFAMSVSKQ